MIKITINFRRDKILEAVDRSKFKRFSKAGFEIGKAARASIETGSSPSAPGRPPRTRRGLLRRAIRYAASKEGAVIGPRASVVGQAGQPHEHGGRYKGESYAARPFMLPALEANVDRFAKDWASSIKE